MLMCFICFCFLSYLPLNIIDKKQAQSNKLYFTDGTRTRDGDGANMASLHYKHLL
jgi:hypothetical protein